MSQVVNRRNFLKWAATGSLGAVLAACAPQVVKETVVVEKEVEKVVTQVVPAGEVVELTYQSRDTGQSYSQPFWDAFFEYFYDKHPNTRIKWLAAPSGGDELMEHLMAQAVAGDGPDVFQLCCVQTSMFMQQGQTLNLQPYIDRDSEQVNIEDFHAQQFNPWKLNGDIHYMPYYTGTVALYYNKDMFDELGVEYLPSEWGQLEFDDFRQMLHKFVRRERPTRWGASNYALSAAGYAWVTQIWLRGFGTHMVNPDDPDVSMLCSPEAMECLEIARQMIHEEHTFAYGAETGGQSLEVLFNNGAVGIMECGSWMLRALVTGGWSSDEGGDDWLDFEWDVAPMWSGPGGITTHQSVDGQACWAKTPNPDMAWELCKEVASVEFETLDQTLGSRRQPSRKSVMPIWARELRTHWPILEKVNLEVFVEAMEQNHGAPEEMFAKNDFPAKYQILQPAFDQVMLENAAPTQLICEYSKIIEKLNRDEISIEQIGGEMAKIQL